LWGSRKCEKTNGTEKGPGKEVKTGNWPVIKNLTTWIQKNEKMKTQMAASKDVKIKRRWSMEGGTPKKGKMPLDIEQKFSKMCTQ